ncbi:BnaCnng59000D [Brassica napus]|uniref:BnaCnng59000D protein n=2 Tax=Brassica TaxID=3705 RepID=A0A078JLQ3_BRANA|nr:BnaCnng59000D [Brassica napus]
MKRSYYHGSSPHEHWPSSCKKRTEEASSESDLSKSELLEALRRSQTRAREAENMAKEACAEKA